MTKQLSFDEVRPDRRGQIAGIAEDRSPISLLLNGLQDLKNIGGLFRTADAARLKEIILYQCPVDFDQHKFKKTARSTIKYVPYRVLETEAELLAYAEDHLLVAIEYTNDSTILSDTELSTPITLVLGNERNGVSPELLALSKQAVHLPMLGVQTSLNVCTAGSIAIYELLRRL